MIVCVARHYQLSSIFSPLAPPTIETGDATERAHTGPDGCGGFGNDKKPARPPVRAAVCYWVAV